MRRPRRWRACLTPIRRFRPAAFARTRPSCLPIGPRRANCKPNESEGADMRVGIATDHGGFELKDELVTQLRTAGHEVVDFGAYKRHETDDYPDFVVPLA